MTILYIFLVIFLLITPLLGLFVSVPFYFKAKKPSQKIIFSALLGVLVGVFAYHFNPEPSFDIVRHQAVVERYSSIDTIDGFVDTYPAIDLEVIPQFYSFIISKTGNLDLLQFFVVAIGFALIFFILIDYKNKKELELKYFLPIFVVALFAQPLIYYFSGLYNYFAISLFAFAFYLDYIKHRKIAPYILYVSTIFIHNSMLFPVLLLLLFKLCGNRINIKTCAIFIGGAILVPLAIAYMVESLGVTSLEPIKNTLNAYMTRNDDFSKFYTGTSLVVDILKYIVAIVACLLARKDKGNKEYYDFALLFLVSSGLMLINSIVFIRFFSLVSYLSIIPMMDVTKSKSKGYKYLLLLICVTALVSSAVNLYKIYPYGYQGFTRTKITTNITSLFRKA